MAKITIFHNPRCSKSRNGVACLRENNTDNQYNLEVVEYTKNPPSQETLRALGNYLGIEQQDPASRPWEVLLRPEAKKRANSLEEAYALIEENPLLLERPFVIDWERKKAAIGRPDASAIEKLIAEHIEFTKQQ
ncbi:arsenate reductase [Mycotypha africana]|uniref:arsenate reductase n=1 Tax=Mycotypha africana TaxID=64632 RepID=UPI0023011217|nr:arsenate reductase [Mycotypha africana]KAI8975230.1 arsenate reductase [Mycotypha africana]